MQRRTSNEARARLTSGQFKQGTSMKKIVIAAALLTIGGSAHAGTYNYDGVTIHVQNGCMSSSCVSVNAPGYGYYHGGHQARIRKVHKDTSRVASARKEDAAVGAAPVAAVTPPAEATPAKNPEQALDTVAPAAPSNAAPAK
jgi:hypothetical protein